MTEDPSNQPQRQLIIASNEEFKTYLIIEKGVVIAEKYTQLINGQEVLCEKPKKEECAVAIPQNPEDNLEINVLDASGKPVRTLHQTKQLDLFEGWPLQVRTSEMDKWAPAIDQLNNCEENIRQKVKEALSQQMEQNSGAPNFSNTLTLEQVTQTIETTLNQEKTALPETFFNTVNSLEEFGISRIVADKMYNLHRLLNSANIIPQDDKGNYIIQAEIKDSYNNTLQLEQRFQATSVDEAGKTGRMILQKLKGIQVKIWLGCWAMANQKRRLMYTCQITELMSLCNPNREAYFTSEEKLDFYQHLRSLENTKFVLKKLSKRKKKDGTNDYDSYEIRLLDIHRHKGSLDEKYPREITMTVLNTFALPTTKQRKTAFVGVGVKKKTLEMHADDALLAFIIQTRKNQRINEPYTEFKRSSLIEIAGLEKTDKSNKSQANKKLLEKLQRYKENGIILDYPPKITDNIKLKFR